MATQARRKLVTIEDSTLAGLAASPTALAAFPFLRPLGQPRAAPAGKCGRCGRAQPVQAPLFASARVAIANMDKANKQKLKDLLAAEQVRIVYRVPDKTPGRFRMITLTF